MVRKQQNRQALVRFVCFVCPFCVFGLLWVSGGFHHRGWGFYLREVSVTVALISFFVVVVVDGCGCVFLRTVGHRPSSTTPFYYFRFASTYWLGVKWCGCDNVDRVDSGSACLPFGQNTSLSWSSSSHAVFFKRATID